MVFADLNEIISGGNFHGEYPAKVLDYLAIGIHELANMSERRTERLVNPGKFVLRGLDTCGNYFAIVYKGENFCDFLFLLHHANSIKRSILNGMSFTQTGEIISFSCRPLFRKEAGTILKELPVPAPCL